MQSAITAPCNVKLAIWSEDIEFSMSNLYPERKKKKTSSFHVSGKV
jgi:hypothetical protein